jgi:hypothetical protein
MALPSRPLAGRVASEASRVGGLFLLGAGLGPKRLETADAAAHPAERPAALQIEIDVGVREG